MKNDLLLLGGAGLLLYFLSQRNVSADTGGYPIQTAQAIPTPDSQNYVPSMNVMLPATKGGKDLFVSQNKSTGAYAFNGTTISIPGDNRIVSNAGASVYLDSLPQSDRAMASDFIGYINAQKQKLFNK